MDTFWMLIHAPFPVLSFIPLSIIHSWPILLFFSCRERLRGSTTRFPHHKIPLLIFPFLYIIYFYPFAPFSLLIRSGGYETLHPERNYLAIPFLIAILLVAFLKSSSIFVLFFIVIIIFFSCITTYGKSSCWKDQQLLRLMHSCACSWFIWWWIPNRMQNGFIRIQQRQSGRGHATVI